MLKRLRSWIMDKIFRKQLYKWVYDKIKSNPKKFGGDYSNSLIMLEYLKEFYSDFSVHELEPQLMSILSTISRIKNKLLENEDIKSALEMGNHLHTKCRRILFKLIEENIEKWWD